MTKPKHAHILVPSDSHGSFFKLCEALRGLDWGRSTLTIGPQVPVDLAPDLVVITMGTERSVRFAIAAIHRLSKSGTPDFAFFANMDAIRACIATKVPERLGNRVKFAVLSGITQDPVGWPDLKVIRILEEPNGTDVMLVAGTIGKIIDPPPPITQEVAKEQVQAA